MSREKENTTGIGFTISIPHGKSKGVVFGRKNEGVDWNSYDDTLAKLIFMIAVPEESAGNKHLKILQMLFRKLMNEEYKEQYSRLLRKNKHTIC